MEIDQRSFRRRDRRLSIAIVAACATTGFGVLAYDTSWVGSGKPISAASMKASLDEIQSRLNALETKKTSYIRMAMGAPSQCAIAVNDTIGFTNPVDSRGITASGNGINLLAGHTYRLEAVLDVYPGGGAGYVGYQFASNGAVFGDRAYTSTPAASSSYGMHAGLLKFITPPLDTNLTIQVTDASLGAGCVYQQWATYFSATEI